MGFSLVVQKYFSNILGLTSFAVLWSWFPFSLVGIRMGLLFICAFAIFVLRVAQLHVGIRTTNSPFQTFRQYLPRYQTTQTTAWYLFSAWLFSEVYIFSAPSSADLRWIVGGNNQERLKLNERPIYLLCYTLMLALLQTLCHLYYDYDRINFKFKETRLDTPSDKPSHMTIPPSDQLVMVFSGLISTAFKQAFSMALIAPLIYYFNVRNFAWNWSLYIAKIFWNLPRSNALPNISSAYIMLIGRTFMAGFILTIMWGFSNAVFSAYVAEEPLKKGRPITHESRDPNGSLLTGLRGKKLQTRVS
jgi:nucleoporin NDC1